MSSDDSTLVDITLKRKSETVAERVPTKQQSSDQDLLLDDAAGKKPGRKLINAELPINATNSDKRRAQNRAAQRAFRERKERYVKELEDRINSLEGRCTEDDACGNDEELRRENEQLRSLIKQLTEENRSLKDSQFTFRPPNAITPSASTVASLPLGHPSPISPTAGHSSPQHNPRQLQTPPDTTLEEFAATTSSDAFDTSALVFQQMLQSAASTVNPNGPITLTGSVGQIAPANIESSTSSAGLNAALYLLGAQTGSFPGATVTSTPGTLTTFTDDLIVHDSFDPTSATAVQELFAGQLFPPLGPPTTASASQSPSLPIVSDGIGSFASLSATTAATAASSTAQATMMSANAAVPPYLGALSSDLTDSLFTQYRDPNSLEALLSEPMELPLPGANGIPLNFEDLTSSSLSAAMPLPLGVLSGIGAKNTAATTTAAPATAISPLMFQDEQQLEKICGSGVLSDTDLDFLCSELTTKCRAAKEAAVAKLERLKQEQTEQEQRVARAIMLSAHMDSVEAGVTSPLPPHP